MAGLSQDAARISIHAPREGSDGRFVPSLKEGEKISIHAPREGSDLDAVRQKIADAVFLSTLPARGATMIEAFTF